MAACVCAWSHSCISFELKRRLRLSDVGSRKRRCPLMMVAMPGKLRMSIVPLLGGGLLMTDSLRALRLPWGASSISGSIDAQFEIIRSALSSKSLTARSHPAQNGEDETSEGGECSQAAVDDGEVTGIAVGSDWERLEIGGCRIHGWFVSVGSCAA